ncbi:hypothetical protein COY32_03820 [candidate division WWE3 bacterium CG_4_10_14_0_2_um_filter_41_14]|uniref:Uncharacterized protein n=1 Tax=candidate division WWE3 bacterium CG_4_10_14_0_2_um_filter_41_14 TaxID=1975072 RepID=A0A2M7TII0_UNCKA|nr:MAG: hypothetical protein COY32_03820 [candidate division WWE3 bacterium CG_4_10_14_0_2_um_filter_41_14]
MRVFRILATIVVVLIFSISLIVSPDKAYAIVRSSNTSIFTGRFIPAFLGGAYDPTPAFSELAGLPVYVFAYDFWNGANQAGENSWIISDIAVRSQIRADGSFQVQGLPTASHYGVYFPFELAPNGSVNRTDCTGTGNETDPCFGDTNAYKYDFRMPISEDKIIDVFSYAPQYLSVPVTVQSQVNSPDGYENVVVKHAFVTNRTDVDIANNINTFPLVPNHTLHFVVTETGSTITGASEYEVVAIRIAAENMDPLSPSQNLSPRIDFPIIRGRAQKSDHSAQAVRYVFQAYAPQGLYVITTWRKETDSPTYADWDTVSSLKSRNSAIAQLWIKDKGFDWRDALSQSNQSVVILSNRIYVWGVVTDQQGNLMTSLNKTWNFENEAVPLDNIQVGIASDKVKSYYSYDPLNLQPNAQETIFLTPALSESRGVDIPETIWGVYMFGLNWDFLFSNGLTPQQDTFQIYLANGGDEYQPLMFRSPGYPNNVISSYDGPIQVSFTVPPKCTDINNCVSGYTDGVFIEASLDAAGTKPAIGAQAIVQMQNPKIGRAIATGKEYYLDRAGELHIPASDLIAGTEYKITLYDHLNQLDIPNIVYTGEGVVSIKNNVLVRLEPKFIPKYNLDLANWIDETFSPTQAYASDYVSAVVSVILPRGSSVSSLTVDIQDDANNYSCFLRGDTPCKLLDMAGTDLTATRIVPITVPVDGVTPQKFMVNLPVPQLVDINGLSVQAAKITYQVVVSAEIDGTPKNAVSRVSVRNDETIEPIGGNVTVNLAQSQCEILGDSVADTSRAETNGWIAKHFMAGLNGWVAKISCNVTNTMFDALPSVFSGIYRYGLQTRALQQESAILRFTDVVRNFANIMFIFMFIVISIMTILRYQPEKWHVRVLLPKVLIALVLSNFSIPIVQAFLDLNNFLSFTLFSFTVSIIDTLRTSSLTQLSDLSANVGAVGAVGGVAAIGFMASAISNIVMGFMSVVGFTGGLGGGAILLGVVGFVVGLILSLFMMILQLLLVFISRYAVIWLITIVGPLVFLIDVLPWFGGMQDKWFKTLVSFSFMQTTVAALMCVGVLLLTVASGDDSFLSGWGVILVSLVIFATAVKIPKAAINSALSQLGGGSIDIGAIGKPKSISEISDSVVEKREAAYSRDAEYNKGQKLRGKKPTAFGRFANKLDSGINATKYAGQEKQRAATIASNASATKGYLRELRSDFTTDPKNYKNLNATNMSRLNSVYEDMPKNYGLSQTNGSAFTYAELENALVAAEGRGVDWSHPDNLVNGTNVRDMLDTAHKPTNQRVVWKDIEDAVGKDKNVFWELMEKGPDELRNSLAREARNLAPLPGA